MMKLNINYSKTLALTLLCLFFKFNATAQTIIFDSGFETGDPAFIYNSTTNTVVNTTTTPNSGTNRGGIGTVGSTFDGCFITGTALSFTAGKYYQVEVIARTMDCTSKLQIYKNTTATNAAMKASVGGDIILSSASNNVTSTTYSSFSAIFLGTTETKYVGFQVKGTGGGACAAIDIGIDDILITEYDYPPCGFYCTAGAASSLASGAISGVVFDAISRSSTYDGYICTGQQANVRQTLSYPLQVDRTETSTFTFHTEAWIDWDQNGVFGNNANEIVMADGSSNVTGTVSRSVTVTVPAGALVGLTKMRVILKYNTAPNANGCETATYTDAEDYDINVMPAPVPMVYTSTTVTQNTASVNAGTTKQQVLMMDVFTTGQLTPPSATQFVFTTLGTTAVANITNARMYFTGTNSTYSSLGQVGATIAVPPADPATMTFNMSQVLAEGDNYFWIAYDVVAAAPGGNVIDAKLVSTTVGGTTYTLNSNPAGNRPIIGSFPMSYVSSTVVQNSNPVAIGTANNDVISVQVVTTGAITPLSATSLTFQITGTTNLADITNAKVYFTADNPVFSTAVQFGPTTAPVAGPTNFTIAGAATLVQGTNYFWLTYDVVGHTAVCPAVAQIDGLCNNILISGVNHTPTTTAPAGARIINCGSPYYSQGSLNACLLTSWNSQRNGSGSAPASFAAGNDFYIQNGHSMTTSSAITIPHLYVETGGYITASFLITMTDLLVETGATFEQTAAAPTSNTTYITNFTIKVGGTWKHNNSGALPGVNRYFDPYSIQWFLGIGGGTFPSGTNWGSVILDIPVIGNLIINATSISYIHGDFTFKRWGNGTTNQMYVNYDNPITVDGDMYIQGGVCKGMAGFNCTVFCNCNQLMATPISLSVAGSLYVSGGEWDDLYCTKSGSSTGTAMTVGGNVVITGGVFNMNSIVSGNTNSSNIHLQPITPSTVWSQTGGTITLPNTFVDDGKTVTLTGSKMGDVYTGKTITVGQGTSGVLYCSNYPVTGAGNFTLANAAKLGIGSAAGITSSGATGNILVSGTRSYNTGATYEYYEGLTPQITGNFTTTTTSATYPAQVANLIINKTGATNIVTLTNTTDVNNVLTLTKGVLTTSATAATAPWVRIPTDVASVSPVGGSQNSYVDGYIRKTGSAAFIYPTGDGGKWRRIAQSAPSASTEFEAKYVATGYTNTSTMSAAPLTILSHVSTLEHWFLSKPLGATASTTKVTLYWEDASVSQIYKFDSLAVARWSGTGWEDANCYTGCPANWTSSTTQRTYTGSATGTGAGTITSNTVSSFSPFTFSSIGKYALNPLPVELLYFDAKYNGASVDVSWKTASEINCDFFTVERSIDGTEFMNIGTVPSKSVRGNSTTELKYFLDDKDVKAGMFYYRLKQTDFDNNYKYSTIVPVTIGEDPNSVFIVKPNPTINNAEIIYNCYLSETALLKVYDYSGRLVVSREIHCEKGMNSSVIDLNQQPEGIYSITLTTNSKVYKSKLIKSK